MTYEKNTADFKALIAEIGISNEDAVNILKKHNICTDFIADISDTPDFEITSHGEFEYHLQNGDIKEITKDMLDYVSFASIYAVDEYEFVLDAYFKEAFALPTKFIAVENRAWVFAYLEKNKPSAITFGLDEEWDIEQLKKGKRPDINLDFENWSSKDLSVFDYNILDGSIRRNLLDHLILIFKHNTDFGDNFYNFFKTFLIKCDGFQILLYANTQSDSQILENILNIILNDSAMHSLDVMRALKKYDIANHELLYKILVAMQFNTLYMFPAKYINVFSFINYVCFANVHIKNSEKEIPEWYQSENLNKVCNIYRRQTTNEEDERLRHEYQNIKFFTALPLMCNFNDIIERHKNTGDIIESHILETGVDKPFRKQFVEFMLNEMSTENVTKLIEADEWLDFEVFKKSQLKRSDEIEILKKFPELIVYYTYFV